MLMSTSQHYSIVVNPSFKSYYSYIFTINRIFNFYKDLTVLRNKK